MQMSILNVLANYISTTLDFRAHESHVGGGLTLVRSLLNHAILQRKLVDNSGLEAQLN